jgi:hypothetical protein
MTVRCRHWQTPSCIRQHGACHASSMPQSATAYLPFQPLPCIGAAGACPTLADLLQPPLPPLRQAIGFAQTVNMADGSPPVLQVVHPRPSAESPQDGCFPSQATRTKHAALCFEYAGERPSRHARFAANNATAAGPTIQPRRSFTMRHSAVISKRAVAEACACSLRRHAVGHGQSAWRKHRCRVRTGGDRRPSDDCPCRVRTRPDSTSPDQQFPDPALPQGEPARDQARRRRG